MDLVAKSQHLMGNLPMTSFSGSCKPTIIFTTERLGALLSVGDLPLLSALFHSTALIVVGWIIGTTLPIKLAIHMSQPLRIGSDIRTEHLK